MRKHNIVLSFIYTVYESLFVINCNGVLDIGIANCILHSVRVAYFTLQINDLFMCFIS